ncbi:MAG: TIGR02281 family clan AA aspartic protease [Pseudomonadota bacterium]
MWRYLIMAVSLIGTATTMPALLQDKVVEARTEPVYSAARSEPTPKARKQRNPLARRVAEVDADRRGHFIASARMNGRRMDVLVDTGATLVAINESTARRIGIRLKPADFKYRVRTANGITKAAAATIDEIQIGRIIVRDVRASVSKDSSLSTVLLGMSFLNKLKKFEINSGTLVLMQ